MVSYDHCAVISVEAATRIIPFIEPLRKIRLPDRATLEIGYFDNITQLRGVKIVLTFHPNDPNPDPNTYPNDFDWNYILGNVKNGWDPKKAVQDVVDKIHQIIKEYYQRPEAYR